jgi:hypothetical protein
VLDIVVFVLSGHLKKKDEASLDVHIRYAVYYVIKKMKEIR